MNGSNESTGDSFTTVSITPCWTTSLESFAASARVRAIVPSSSSILLQTGAAPDPAKGARAAGVFLPSLTAPLSRIWRGDYDGPSLPKWLRAAQAQAYL